MARESSLCSWQVPTSPRGSSTTDSAGYWPSGSPKEINRENRSRRVYRLQRLATSKGQGQSSDPSLIIVVQAADLVQARKLTPDLATWLQCFGLFYHCSGTQESPTSARTRGLYVHNSESKSKYKWPWWVIYDQNFRMEVAGTSQSWARVAPSIYAQCFTGQAINVENWCAQCQGLDHSSARCPYRPQKQP